MSRCVTVKAVKYLLPRGKYCQLTLFSEVPLEVSRMRRRFLVCSLNIFSVRYVKDMLDREAYKYKGVWPEILMCFVRSVTEEFRMGHIYKVSHIFQLFVWMIY